MERTSLTEISMGFPWVSHGFPTVEARATAAWSSPKRGSVRQSDPMMGAGKVIVKYEMLGLLGFEWKI